VSKCPLVALLIYVLTILCCVVRYDFRMKTVFGSSLPPVVCIRGSYLVYVICVYLCVVVSNTCILLYFCFVFHRFVYKSTGCRRKIYFSYDKNVKNIFKLLISVNDTIEWKLAGILTGLTRKE
jgi:hypothetical protein